MTGKIANAPCETFKSRRNITTLSHSANDSLGLKRSALGFTLAELLIALAILGVIATFTIPKVLQAQQSESYKSIAKEAAGAMSDAYNKYRSNYIPDTNTGIKDLTQYLNYVRTDTSALTIDLVQTQGTTTCDSTNRCLRLHNGANIRYHQTATFGGTATTNAIWFQVDPDAKITDGTTNGPGKAVSFNLYYNGRLSTYGEAATNTCNSAMCWNGDISLNPPWFSW